MSQNASPPSVADETRALPGPVQCPEDVLDAMLASVEDGALHLRPTLGPDTQSNFELYVEIGVALRHARRTPIATKNSCAACCRTASSSSARCPQASSGTACCRSG